MTEETVTIPSPYTGLTARLGKVEINVHEVKDGIVYFGKYHDDADDAPWHCVALLHLPVEDFINRLGRGILDGAVTFSRIATSMEDF